MAIDDGGTGTGSPDPRLSGEFERTVERDGVGTVHLVGVVHDHPASAFRARSAVEVRSPAVLALEIAPLALPLFEAYADGARDPTGGTDEFTTAIRAAADARVVGIDAPSRRFVGTLARKCLAETLPLSTVRSVLRGLAAVSREATTCRLAAAVTANTLATVAVGEPVAHDCTPADDPETQAADEARQVERVRNVLSVLDRPPAVRVRDEVREECMSRALDDLRREGDVVAVVGLHHLDPVADALHVSSGE